MTALLESREVRIVLNAFWPMLKQGLIYSIPLTLISFAIGMVIAILSALLIINKVPVLAHIMRFYVWVFRGTPLLVQLFIVYWGICNPMKISNLIACVIALSLNVGAYASETIRAAILSIDRGQWEAGYSIGMTYRQAFWRIIVPQAAKVSVPPLFNTFISLVKDTSLASNIMIAEMFRKAQEFAASSLKYLLIYSEAALIYLMFCTILNGVQKLCERKLRVGK
ncbi:MAG: amino acid ABC transporter permease [Clostridia bacterium]|nr:amino acid ABC transporter permease [Clostridia bacterium]MBR6889473.1 amino acid ABC transporter permease [Clostridia bacterium]